MYISISVRHPPRCDSVFNLFFFLLFFYTWKNEVKQPLFIILFFFPNIIHARYRFFDAFSDDDVFVLLPREKKKLLSFLTVVGFYRTVVVLTRSRLESFVNGSMCVTMDTDFSIWYKYYFYPHKCYRNENSKLK